jgi:2-polyprenyl-6-methoxyphenol hydroxylase-like FAD-dependent oxidoreductase
MKSKDPGSYKFFNLETLERKYAAPVDPERMRIRREGLRKLLCPGLKVCWDVKVETIDLESDGVSITLPDHSTYKGKLLVGADGSGSAIRKYLCPDHAENIPLPLRFIGVVVKLTPEATASITDIIDPLTFQGCHPLTGVYMFWCLVSTPQLNGSADSSSPYYQAQICVSWKPAVDEGEIPSTPSGKVQRIRDLCANMASPIKNMVDSIPEDSEPIAVKLQDWPCLDWDNRDGRITLAGDSAHAMTMCKLESLGISFTFLFFLFVEETFC